MLKGNATSRSGATSSALVRCRAPLVSHQAAVRRIIGATNAQRAELVANFGGGIQLTMRGSKAMLCSNKIANNCWIANSRIALLATKQERDRGRRGGNGVENKERVGGTKTTLADGGRGVGARATHRQRHQLFHCCPSRTPSQTHLRYPDNQNGVAQSLPQLQEAPLFILGSSCFAAALHSAV